MSKYIYIYIYKYRKTLGSLQKNAAYLVHT